MIPWEDNQTFTDLQRDILVGSLLGDGRLECRSQNGTARFRVHHADSQRELLFWKFHAFQDFVLRAPWATEWFDARYGRWYRSWFFHTVTTPRLRPLHVRFYAHGEKHIPRDIAGDLTPRALAVWIMDDGCLTRHELILNTQSFPFAEQELLLRVMRERFAVSGTINRDRRNYRLRFSKSQAKKLSGIVRPFIIPSLQMKIVPVTTASSATTGPVAAESTVEIMAATTRRSPINFASG